MFHVRICGSPGHTTLSEDVCTGDLWNGHGGDGRDRREREEDGGRDDDRCGCVKFAQRTNKGYDGEDGYDELDAQGIRVICEWNEGRLYVMVDGLL